MPSCRSAQRFPRRAPGGSPSSWTRVPPALMTAKFSRYWRNPQDTCSQNPRHVFSEVAEAPQAATTQTHPTGRPWNRKKWQNPQDTCSKNPGACFFWGRRSAAGSHHQTHRAGDHKLVSKQCQRRTLSKNSGAKPCQRNILSKSYILTVSDGIFWVSPVYLLYLMECFKLKGKGRVTGKGSCNRKRYMYI